MPNPGDTTQTTAPKSFNKSSFEDQLASLYLTLKELQRKAEVHCNEQLRQEIFRVEQQYNILKGILRLPKIHQAS